MKLSKLEQESIILYNEEESTASIYTHDPKLKRKLKRLAEKYPDKVYPDTAMAFWMIILVLVISLAWFAALSFLTARWFEKKEVG